MSLLLIDDHRDDLPTEPSVVRGTAAFDPQARPIDVAIADDGRQLGSILDDLDDFAGLDDTMRAFEDELRSIGRSAAAPSMPAGVLGGLPAADPVIDAELASPPTVVPEQVVPEQVVADHIAALEERLERTFDLAGVDDPPEAGAAAPIAAAVAPIAGAAAPDVADAEVTGIESYAELAGADDDEIETTAEGLVPLALTPTATMSPAAAAAKRHGRRRLVLLLAVVSGLIAFVGLAAAATAQASTSEAALSVVEASTTTAPITAAPTTAAPTTAPPPETTAPTTEAPATTQAPTTVAPTTAAPSTTVATTVPVTPVPTTARPTTTYAAPTTVANYGFLDCVRARESRGDYSAMNPSGAHGAYQMMPTTARETALRAGRTDLASTPVLNWSKTDQDAMAAHLYQWQGAAPWGGGCSYPTN